MQAADSMALVLRFGVFELDLRNSELRRGGVLLKLSPQQFQVLRILAESSGQLLTREELQRAVWGADTFVDFDRNLNVCVAQIRSTLGDDADAPRFIQTVPKRGYRFIAPVEKLTATSAGPAAGSPPRTGRTWVLVAGIAASFLIAGGYVAWRRTPAPQRVMLATLPFENMSGDPAADPFTDGLTDELISQFGGLQPERLGVIGRSSVMRYKGAPHGIDQVRRDLHVDYVVEGTVRRSAGRIRISASLIQTADQAQVWTGTSESQESEMFQMQEDAAARIAAAVAGKILAGGPAPRSQARTHNPDAYSAYLNGRYLQHKQNRDELRRSFDYFEQAARLDPSFDAAYAALAESLVSLGRSGSPAEELFPRARAAAEKALSIQEANAEAHLALANVSFWREWNWRDAEQHFTRALAINPSLAAAHHDYAFFLIAMGRTGQGLTSLRRAIALDPLSARINIDAGWLLLQAHRFDEAIQQARRAMELEPNLAEANGCIQRSLFYQKKYGEIVKMLPAAPAGRNAGEIVREAYRRRVERSDPFTAASIHAFLGDKAKALDALDQAYASRGMMMPLLKSEPALESLHQEPRFRELVRKLGLP